MHMIAHMLPSLLGLVCFASLAPDSPVDPDASLILLLPKNLTYNGESVITVPDIVELKQEDSLFRIEKLHDGAVQSWLESNGNVVWQLGVYFQNLLDSFTGRDGA